MKNFSFARMFAAKRLGLVFLFNIVIGIILTVLSNFDFEIDRLALFRINLVYANCIGFSIYFALNFLNIFQLPRWIKLITTILTINLASLVGGFLGNSILVNIFGVRIPFFKMEYLLFFLIVSLIFGAIANFLFLLLEKNYQRRILLLEEKHARTEAELNALRTRINPHFLFNTLNSISGLIYISPEKADDVLQKLSELMRYTLNVANIKESNIEDEIEIVKNYLEIEKIRFDDRLKFFIKNESKEFGLPPLLILTLVENAIKHGIAKSVEGGIVEVNVSENNKNVSINVSNSGMNLPENYRLGIGLTTLKRLLFLHYKDKAKFDLETFDGKTSAKILIKRDTL